ncbi:MAG TPA: hypothetical protein EYO61_05485 [Campylobacterales bacterium]|nr:hypothetical protein [Campylobacterales bacterium]
MVEKELRKNFSPSVIKLFVFIFIFVALINTAILSTIEYKQAKRLILREFKFLSLAVSRSLADALWKNNQTLLETIANELLSNYNVSGVKVVNAETHFVEVSKSKQGRENSIAYSRDIIYIYDNKKVKLATLYLYTDYGVVFFRTKRVIGLLLLKSILESFVISLLLFWGFRKLFHHYLIKLRRIMGIGISSPQAKTSLYVAEREFRDTVNRLLSIYFKHLEQKREKQKEKLGEEEKEENISTIPKTNVDLGLVLEYTNPSQETLDRYFHNHFIVYQPAYQGRGDIYLFVEVERGRELLLLLVDYGNIDGLSGIEIALILKDIEKELMVKYSNNNRLFALSKILDFMDKKIRNRLSDVGNRVLDEVEFKGLALTYNKINQTIDYSSRGVFLFKNEDGKFITYDDYGAYNNRVMQHGTNDSKRDHHIDLEPNTTLYIVTDGFFKQVKRDKKKEEIGKKGFMEILERVSSGDFKVQKNSFIDEFNQAKGDKPQNDCVTIIGIETT